MVAVPEWGADSYDACVPAICRGEDSLKLADEIFNLNVALDDSSRPYLAQWAANNAGPIVAGKALITAWRRGHGGSIMGRFTDHAILKWFRRAAPEGLMDEAERKVFNNLPDIVTAYRGAREDMPEDAVGGLSWTLDLKVAVFFARDYRFGRKGPAVVVRADFPRSAIVAYTDGPRRLRPHTPARGEGRRLEDFPYPDSGDDHRGRGRAVSGIEAKGGETTSRKRARRNPVARALRLISRPRSFD
jgi:hypothetical protein